MSDELQTLIKQYKETQWDKLLRKDLGDHHLNEIKPNLDFIKKSFDLIIENYKKLDSEQKNDLQTMLSEFEQHKKRIEQHSKINSTQSIIDNIFTFKNEILNRFQHLIEIFKSLSKNNQNILSDELNKKIKQVEEKFKKAQQMQSQLAARSKREEAKLYGDFFKREAENNKSISRWYGISLYLSTFVAGLFAYCFLQFDPSIEAKNSFELIIKGNLINKIFIFTLILIFISILRRNFLALQHQYTLNKHRHNALSSHKEILSSIMGTASESDKEISNAILLELTKSMFTPQDTGFMQNQKNTSSENRIVEISKSLFNSPKE